MITHHNGRFKLGWAPVNKKLLYRVTAIPKDKMTEKIEKRSSINNNVGTRPLNVSLTFFWT